jgi:hypothetical protein
MIYLGEVKNGKAVVIIRGEKERATSAIGVSAKMLLSRPVLPIVFEGSVFEEERRWPG